LKKKRRIEITAFRRTTTLAASEPDPRLSERVLEGQSADLNFADDWSAPDKQIDVAQATPLAADSVPSPELTGLIEALVVSNGDRPLALQQVGLSRKGRYYRLRSSSSSFKNLITACVSRIIGALSGFKSPRIK
jgi:hypothetical protein